MYLFQQLFKITLKILFLLLLCIIVWQQWATFLKYESKFENPVKFIKENYGNDFISQYGNRFEEIKKMFPQPSRLNYFGEANEDISTGYLHYFLTQYYLSPNLIFRNNDNRAYDTVIYNLYSSKQINPAGNFHLNHGWHVVKDFKNGLIVLAK